MAELKSVAFRVRSNGFTVGALAVYDKKTIRITSIGEHTVDGTQVVYGHDADTIAIPTKEFLASAKKCAKTQSVVVYDDSHLPHMSELLKQDACMGFVRYHLFQKSVKRTKGLSDALELLQDPTMVRLKVPMQKEKLHIRRLAPSHVLRLCARCFSIGPIVTLLAALQRASSELQLVLAIERSTL